jgi:RNA polymerase sigma factor (sigma-70 family)
MRDGKPEAWEEFYATYWRWLLGISHNMGIPNADAEDLVQKVFIQVNRHIHEFVYDPARGRFSGWLIVILGNLAAGYWRRRAHDPLSQVPGRANRSSSQTEPLYRIPDPQKNRVLNEVAANELERILQEGYAQLKAQASPKHWAVFQAYGLEERPVGEVAKEFGLAPGSVYSIDSRLTTQLREIVAGSLNL